jgi:predicted nuclease with TOPRIM domain
MRHIKTAATEMQLLREDVVATENAKSLLEEMRKKREEDKTSCQRERDEMQEQVNRLREELSSAATTQAKSHGQVLQQQRTSAEDERARLETEPVQMHNQANRHERSLYARCHHQALDRPIILRVMSDSRMTDGSSST